MNISYRPDIDGLRTIAVLLVIFNHLGVSFFSGGFIGVDIFFVISGFLITSTLVKDMSDHKYSIGNFYKKRVVRLAPAYFLVLLFVAAFSFKVFLPNELVSFFKSLIYSTFFTANIFMQKEAGNYFSANTQEVPLLHLWSLAVEEQFYIFWPVLLFFLLKRFNHKALAFVVLALIALSLFKAEQDILKNPAKAYYKMPVRAFELFLGALLCFLPSLKIKRFASASLVWLCLLVIFACGVVYSESTHFPGLGALLPCAATALLIYIGKGGLNHNWFLTNALMTGIGKISYPMYLWHWPLIVGCNLYYLPKTIALQAGILLATMLLAFLTYRLAELPARKLLVLSTRKVLVIGFAIPAALFTALAMLVIYQKGFIAQQPELVRQQLAALDSLVYTQRKLCQDYPAADKIPNPDDCVLGVKNRLVDFLLIGDSHATQYSGMLDVWAKDAGLRGFDISQSGAIYLPHAQLIDAESQKPVPSFSARNRVLTEYLQHHQYNYVFYAANYNRYLALNLQGYGLADSWQVMRQGMHEAIQTIYRSGAKAVLVLDNPRLQHVSANCPVRVAMLGITHQCSMPVADVMAQQVAFNNLVKALKADFPDLLIVDPTLAFCDAHYCQLTIDQIPLYKDGDDNHLNYRGSELIGKAYITRFGNPFKTGF